MLACLPPLPPPPKPLSASYRQCARWRHTPTRAGAEGDGGLVGWVLGASDTFKAKSAGAVGVAVNCRNGNKPNDERASEGMMRCGGMYVSCCDDDARCSEEE